MAKEKFKDRVIFYLATRLGWLVILLLGRLTRIEYHNREHLDRLEREGTPYILAIWHGRLLITTYIFRGKGLCAMVSEHRDGEMIAQTIERLGFTTSRGSSTRGAVRATVGLIKALKQGRSVTLMPDGPKGPRHELKRGVISLALKTGAPIILHSFSTDKPIFLRSWDRFLIWKPFSRCAVFFSEPIYLEPTQDAEKIEAIRQEIENRMIALEHEADAYFSQ